ncbi:3'-5' exoribonuclease 1 isoform X1 [Anabrus simplex]|uniref:3'-5' exoribonuclease 1 isoform X1 n=1 Tax=Anabrus simplex TaxID=316456 RepID=UPI0035A39C52
MKDKIFTDTMTKIEKEAWNVFKDVVTKFLGNIKDPQYKEIVRKMLVKFKELGCNMSLKLHFLASHMDYFPQNLGDVSEEQGERFHQDLKDAERRYQGRWDVNMMADYCWSIARDDPSRDHSRTSKTGNSTENGKRRRCESNLHIIHEIIEFPAVLVSTEKLEIVDHFQAYCKPIVNPKLSDFCVELTGITQEKVDNSQPFDEVLESFEAWLKKHKLGSKFKYGVVTDGPWDMGRFLYGQCKISGVPYPRFGNKWINIRKIFSSFYKSKRYCLRLMLEHLDIGFEGRPHCGLDDARNIARILLRLISDGASIQVNERIHLTRCNSKSRGSDGQVEKLVVSIPSNRPTKDYTRVHRDRCRREKKQQQQQQREHTGVSDMESDGSSKETECEDSKNEDKKLGT